MEKYYYDYNEYGACTEECMVHNNDTMIGSVSCRKDCEYCIEHDGHHGEWLICKRIKDATNKR